MREIRQVLNLPIEQVGELPSDHYTGLVDDTAIKCLKVRLEAEGLLTPIWVRQNGNAAKNTPYSVIAGRHRRLAAIALGWTHVVAEVRATPSSTPDEMRRLQLVENLDRRVLRPIERALSIMVRWRDLAGVNAWDIVSQARETDQETARACGVDDRTIRRYRRIYDTIIIDFPDHFAALNAHPLGASFSAMTRLAKLNDLARRKAVETILSKPDWKSIGEALEEAGVSESHGNRLDTRNHVAVMDTAFTSMKLREKRKYLDELPKKLTKEMAQRLVVKLVEEHAL